MFSDEELAKDANAANIPNMMEPLIQIKTETNTFPESVQPVEPDVQILPDITEPDIQIIEDSVSESQVTPQTVKIEKPPENPEVEEHRSFFENIGLLENSNNGSPIAKIGECTISVSNISGMSALDVNTSVKID